MPSFGPPPRPSEAPIIQKIYGLYRKFHGYLAVFPRNERHTLGQTIENNILIILEQSLVACHSSTTERGQQLQIASNKNDLLKYLLRLAYDTRCLNSKQYTTLATEVVEIGRMIGGWIKSNNINSRLN